MPRSTLAFAFAVLVCGCLDPNVGAVYAPPKNRCPSSTDFSCQTLQSQVWLANWYVTAMAARGTKAAFVAYPILPGGGPNTVASDQLGQLDLATGHLDWIVPLGKDADDYYSTSDITIAPSGDIIVAGTGYGEYLLGDKVSQFDGFVAGFDPSGKKRFARRFEIRDAEPNIAYRPRANGAKIIADDILRVQTSFQMVDPGQPPVVAVHLFSFTPEGSQLSRLEVPIEPGSFGGYAWPVQDGSLWVKVSPGPFRRYSKEGVVLDEFELQPMADVRGFAPMSPTTALINLSNKGGTNDMYRHDSGLPLTALFGEPTMTEFHAAMLVPTLGLERFYFVELKYDGLNYRFSTIDAKGNRGPVTTVHQVAAYYTLLDNGEAAFFHAQPTGTEFLVHHLE